MTERQEKRAPLVWLVIVNFNSYGDTADCLRSLRAASWPALRVALVDNGSIDGSAERLRHEFPEVIHLHSEENLGFAGGCNLGIREAQASAADYVCLLNNDTIVEPGFLEPLVARAEVGQGRDGAMAIPNGYPTGQATGQPTRQPTGHPTGQAGGQPSGQAAGTQHVPAIIGGKILYDEPGEIIWFAGGRINPRTGLTTHRGQDLPDSQAFSEPMSVDYITGCLFLVPAKLFSELGLLDERLFMYGEELDFCLRARRAGYACFYEPASVIRHRVSRAMGGAYRPVYYYYLTRNLLEVYRAHLGAARCSVPMVKLYISLVIQQSYTMLRAHRTGALPYINAIWLGFAHFLERKFGRLASAPSTPGKTED